MPDYDETKIANKNDEEINPATEESLETISRSMGFVPIVVGYMYYTFSRHIQDYYAITGPLHANDMFTPISNITNPGIYVNSITGIVAELLPGKDISFKFKGTKIAIIYHWRITGSSEDPLNITITDSSGDVTTTLDFTGASPGQIYDLISVLADNLTDEEHTITISNPSSNNVPFSFSGVFVEKFKNVTMDLKYIYNQLMFWVQKQKDYVLANIHNSLLRTGSGLSFLHLSGNSQFTILLNSGADRVRLAIINVGSVDLTVGLGVRFGGIIYPPVEVRGDSITVENDGTVTVPAGKKAWIEWKLYSSATDLYVKNNNSDTAIFKMTYKTI